MAVIAQIQMYIAVAAATSGGVAPGGTTAPSGAVALTAPTDLSQWVTQAATPYDVAEVDSTNFGTGGFETVVAGLKSGTISFSINQDFAAAAPNALLGINGSVAAPGGLFFVEVRPTSSARSATNPGFIAKVLHKGWKTFNAQVGAISTIDLSLRITGGFGELVT